MDTLRSFSWSKDSYANGENSFVNHLKGSPRSWKGYRMINFILLNFILRQDNLTGIIYEELLHSYSHFILTRNKSSAEVSLPGLLTTIVRNKLKI